MWSTIRYSFLHGVVVSPKSMPMQQRSCYIHASPHAPTSLVQPFSHHIPCPPNTHPPPIPHSPSSLFPVLRRILRRNLCRTRMSCRRNNTQISKQDPPEYITKARSIKGSSWPEEKHTGVVPELRAVHVRICARVDAPQDDEAGDEEGRHGLGYEGLSVTHPTCT